MRNPSHTAKKSLVAVAVAVDIVAVDVDVTVTARSRRARTTREANCVSRTEGGMVYCRWHYTM
jgi:hypothetical protein